MRLVKTKSRYRCDFCNRVSTQTPMKRHEVICWRNPNRHCDTCNDRGFTFEDYGDGIGQDIPCHFCSQFDPSKVPELEPLKPLAPKEKDKR